jgi:hypothetical protein
MRAAATLYPSSANRGRDFGGDRARQRRCGQRRLPGAIILNMPILSTEADSTARDAIASGTRRPLRFESIDDAIAQAERLAAADREGHLVRAGNWTLGQALGHLSTWTDFAFDGYPESVAAPLPVRLILRLMRNRILTKGMMSGVKIRGIEGGTLGTEALSTDEGLQRFRSAMQRLKSTSPAIVNPVFGRLTHEQWIQLNLRHAELHLSFLHPQ